MGKADKKQNRKPKAKGKKQSEPFEKAARKLKVDNFSVEFDGILKAMAGAHSPKYEIFGHKIYNAQSMIKPIGTPFPSDLNAAEWKRKLTITVLFDAAVSDVVAKGYHVYQTDMSREFGADSEPLTNKH